MNKFFFFLFNLFCLQPFLFAQTDAYTLEKQLPQQKVKAKDITALKKRMAGRFDSKDQADKDTNFFAIQLIMKPVWTDRKDGFWLYVEQAAMRKLDKPYRQRAYHVYLQDDKTIVSQVYEFRDPKLYIGEWKKEKPLGSISPDSLISKEGCAIYLHKSKNGNYVGSTPEKECPSSLKGSAYATSEVLIMKNLILSLDRGYDKADVQVWGSENGGYRFMKRENL